MWAKRVGADLVCVHGRGVQAWGCRGDEFGAGILEELLVR